MKPPAFQFYVKDWLGSRSVRIMTPTQRGFYIQLLAEAWDSDEPGTLTNDPEVVARLAGATSEAAFRQSGGDFVVAQFKKVNGHAIVHERLQQERLKQLKWREKCSAGGKKARLNYPSKVSGGVTSSNLGYCSLPLQFATKNKTIADDQNQVALASVWDHYVQTMNKSPLYDFSEARRQKGMARLKESIRQTGDLDNAVKLMKHAIDAVASSPFHMGKNEQKKQYNDWINNLFKSSDEYTKWLAVADEKQ